MQWQATGSVPSRIKTAFPMVMQIDSVIDAKNCGGPLVDLDGRVIGVIIARAGRIRTFVLPSEIVQKLLGNTDK